MARFMADIVAGRDPTAKLQRTVQYTAPADGGVEVDEATKALTVAQLSDEDSELTLLRPLWKRLSSHVTNDGATSAWPRLCPAPGLTAVRV